MRLTWARLCAATSRGVKNGSLLFASLGCSCCSDSVMAPDAEHKGDASDWDSRRTGAWAREDAPRVGSRH